MLCRIARSQLSGSRRDSTSTIDSELARHLEKCQACAEYAQAAGLLTQLLEASSEDDRQDITPLEQMRGRVEDRIDRARSKPATVLVARPAFRLGAAIAVTAVALALIPFSYYKTVGYDIHFGGVNRDLVEQEERICEMLYTLGLDEAGVEVVGCEYTCNVRILDLKSTDEVRLVEAALRTANNAKLTMEVTPLRSEATGSLLNRAQDRIFDGST